MTLHFKFVYLLINLKKKIFLSAFCHLFRKKLLKKLWLFNKIIKILELELLKIFLFKLSYKCLNSKCNVI